MQTKEKSYPAKLASILLFGLIAFGAVTLYFSLFTQAFDYKIFSTHLFSDTKSFLFGETQLEHLNIPIKIDKYLIFQEFKVTAPLKGTEPTFYFGIFFSLISAVGLTILTSFKKTYFIFGGIAWIALFTLSNFNGLNVIQLSSNYALIILLAGSIFPAIALFIWGQNLAYWKRFIIILSGFLLSGYLLIQLSPVPNPYLFINHHLYIPALGFSILWIFWSGHSVVSGIYILLSRINQRLKLRISIQLLLISIIYLGLLFSTLLQLTGETDLPIPTFNPLLLLPIIGLFGWITIKVKTEYDPEMSDSKATQKALYLIGFCLVLWTATRGELSGNQPAQELIKHLTIYSQIGFSIFFLIYIYSNFLSIMDSGKALEKILYKPFSLPTYHVKIGGLIGMLVLTIYADGIIGVQVNSLSNNVLGDYYFDSDQKLEASILYENSWFRYRRNGKAKQSAAQLLFELNQPTEAKRHLEESFAEFPQEDNIILLANRLHLENKPFEAIFYLENGLQIFPESAQIANNLALFYTKVGRGNEAAALLEGFDDETSRANFLALQMKFGTIENNEKAEGLIGTINSLNAFDHISNSDQTDLQNLVFDNGNPLLIHSTLRNLQESGKTESTDGDLALLDSLARDDEYLDYIMDLQETASIRSLSAQRISESIKNLKGLAFRNPGDAAYYLQLSSDILSSNLDFRMASVDLAESINQGFQNMRSYHLEVLQMGGMKDFADSLSSAYGLGTSPQFNPDFISIWGDFHEKTPGELYDIWEEVDDPARKILLAERLLKHKSHNLENPQTSRLGQYLESQGNESPELKKFIQNPDFNNPEQLRNFTEWIGLGEELSANPYITPAIFAALERVEDPLAQYELLNAACEFNRDPILWIRKVNQARKIGLANYATSALEEMKKWVSEEKLLQLQYMNF